MRKKLLLVLGLLFGAASLTYGQERTVRGLVTSESDGQPLVQLTVLVKGTTHGVVTDMDGRYSIQVPGPEAVLVFKYTGYETQEILVAEQSTIDVVMVEGLEEIDEVIVVAFGKTKKSAFTGSAATVDQKELQRLQVSNVTNALANKVPGVVVTSSNNQPGLKSTVRIRGTGSFNASSDPLYVVDGMPYDGDISALNPADIESTTVLKDASSAALYGARGANGVILITTVNGRKVTGKDPCEGGARFSATARVGYNFRGVAPYDVIKDPRVHLSKAYEAAVNEKSGRDEIFLSLAPGGQGAVQYFPFTLPEGMDMDPEQVFVKQADGSYQFADGITDGVLIDQYYNTGSESWEDMPDGRSYWMQADDWAAESYKPNLRQEYNLTMSGSSKRTNYFLSMGYLNDKGYIDYARFSRYTSRLRGEFRPYDWLELGSNVNFAYATGNLLENVSSVASFGSLFAFIDMMAPYYPLYVRDGNGEILKDAWGNPVYDYGAGLEFKGWGLRNYKQGGNPVGANANDINESVMHMINMRNFAEVTLPFGFSLQVNVGFDADNTGYTNRGNALYGQFAGSGSISKETYRAATLSTQQLLNWRYTFAEDHHVDVLLGHEFYHRKTSSLSGYRVNIFYRLATELNQAATGNNYPASSNSVTYVTDGYFGRAQYDYAERYFASISYRRDGSSRFAPGHQWGNFWSLGAAWLISRESFMEATKGWLDLLKFKVSYGVQGNDAIGNFKYVDLYSLQKGEELSITFSSRGNEDLTWETSHNLNVGLEFELLKRRLSGGIDFFRREVFDMLFNRPLPLSSGVSSITENIGSMENIGVDFELRGIPYQDRNVSVMLNVNGGHVRNYLTELPDEWKERPMGYESGYNLYRIGGSIYDQTFVHYVGVSDEGYALYENCNDGLQNQDPNQTAGEEYAIASDDLKRRYLYDQFKLRPWLIGGFGFTVEAFGADLSASFGYSLGGLIYDGMYQDLMHDGEYFGNAWHKDILDSWRPEHRDTDIPMVAGNKIRARYSNATSDRFLISRNYLSVNNLTLGYTLPKKLTERALITNLRVYAVADNLGLLSARKGLDPRFGGGLGYKVQRTISMGLQISF